MPRYQILYWRDLPAQVRVYDGRRPVARALPERFQQEIDRAAMAEGVTGTDAYLDHWQWSECRERAGSVSEVLDSLVRELVEEHEQRR